MAIRNNPSTVSSNLRFAYDIADVKNCYIGEPTTNLTNFDIASVTTNTDTPAQITVTSNSSEATYQGRLSKKISILSGYWNAYFYSYNTGVSSTKFAVSYKVKVSDGSNPSAIIGGGYIYGSAGTFFPSPSFTYLGDGWYLATMLYSGTSMTLNSLTGMNGGGPGVIYITDYQAEAKDHATPFAGVAGTRSSTQGLLDISGYGRTIDLSNMSFDSNAQMTFDGTDDYIPSIGSAIVGAGSSPYTVSVWVNRSRNNVGYEELLAQWTNANSGNSFFFGFDNSNVRFTDNWNPVTVSGAGNTGVWMNLVGVNTGANAYIYLNGSLAATKGSALTYTGTGPFIIGRQGELAGEYFQGKLNKVQVYNRALSSDEVLQNYNSFKKRFNL